MAPTLARRAAVVVVVALAASTIEAFTTAPSSLLRNLASTTTSTTTTSLNVGGGQPQQFYDADGNPVSMPMVYDANGNMVPFNPAAAAAAPPPVQQPPQQQQSQAVQQPPPFEPPLPAKTKNSDVGRPVGFNSDAYTMSNTADVYFAQLKQDSKVRKRARLSGDVETANRVFGDDSIREIGDSWNENPYTKEKNYAEARAEIEGTVRLQVQGDIWENTPKTYAGVSYKDRLERARKERKAGPGVAKIGGAAPMPKVEEQPVVVAPPPKVETPAAAVAPPKMEQPAPVVAPPKVETPAAVVTAPKVEQPVVSAPPKVESPPKAEVPAAVAPAAPSGPSDAEDMRRKVRTLQGLLLKHRGGPGFGAGRLKAPEAKRLEETVKDVVGSLKGEVGFWEGSKPAEVEKVESVAKAPVVESKPEPMVELKPEPLVTQPVVQSPPPVVQSSPPPAAVADPLATSMAEVEATLQRYKDADPSEREGMVMEFRAALMAAASATNSAIMDGETQQAVGAVAPAVAAAPVAPAAPAQPAMGFPETYAVTKSEEPEPVAPAAPAAPAMGFPETYAVTKSEEPKVVAPAAVAIPKAATTAATIDTSNMTNEDKQLKLGAAVAQMDSATVASLLASGVRMDEATADDAFWTVVRAVDRAEAEDKPLPESVPGMLHAIFDADMQHLLTREKNTLNVTCMQPDQLGANRIAMNSIFDDAAHKDLPLTEGRRCEDGNCCDKCSRNVFPTFALDSETNFDLFPGFEGFTFNELEKVSAASIIQFIRLIERVRRTIAHEYGLPLKTVLPLQAYSRKYVAGTTQQGGGGGEGDFVILHTDEATHTGYHYSCVLYLSTQGEDFGGGNFVFNDPAAPGAEQEDLSHLSFEEQVRRSGRELKPYGPTKGAAVIFSSGWENMHEVEKITAGTRYAVPCFFTTCPVPEEAYQPPMMAVGKPQNDEMIADDWLHLLLAHREEAPHESLGRVKELLMKWHYLCTPLAEH